MVDLLLVAGHLEPALAAEIASLAERLAPRQIHPRALCLSAGEVPPAGLNIIEVPALESPLRRSWTLRRLAFPDGWRPQVIHVLDTSLASIGLAIAEAWDCPYVLSVTEFPPPSTRLALGKSRFRGIVVPSAALAHDLVHSFKIPAAWVAIIPPGVPLPDPSLCLHPNSPLKLPVVGMILPDQPDQGLLTFLEAAKSLLAAGLDAEFLIAGEGLSEATLRRLSIRLRLADRVTFADSFDMASAFWTVFDVYCQSAAQPCVGPAVATAMAHACPVVVSDVPGLRDWIKHGETGHIVPPNDPAALASAIRQLIFERDEARLLGQAARQWVATHLSPDKEADQLATLYRGLLQLAEPAPSSTHANIRAVHPPPAH